MLNIELYNDDSNGEPAASFATDAEIEIADRLRHQLEERYLAPSARYSPSQVASGQRPLIRSIECRVRCGAGSPAPANKRRLETVSGSA